VALLRAKTQNIYMASKKVAENARNAAVPAPRKTAFVAVFDGTNV
jgi:hypothetical protein